MMNNSQDDSDGGARQRHQPTQKEIAEALGLSPSTVSLALRDSPRVAPATREKIRQKMGEFGYVRNIAAAALRTGRTGIVGVSLYGVAHHFFADLTMQIGDALAESGCAMLVNYHADDPGRLRQFIDTLVSYRAAGLILSPSTIVTPQDLAPLTARGVPVVYLLRGVGGDAVSDHIKFAGSQASQDAANHLIRRGHRRLAMIGGQENSEAAVDRAHGFFEALKKAGIPCDDSSWIRGGANLSDGVAATRIALERQPEATGFVCLNDLVALGAMNVASSKGLTPGADVGIVGFGDIAESAVVTPSLTTMSLGAPTLGTRVAKILLERLDGPQSPPRHERIQPKLVIRESCGFRGST